MGISRRTVMAAIISAYLFIILPRPVMMQETVPYPAHPKLMALTFDADMTPGMQDLLSTGKVGSWYDSALIDYLTGNEVKATLFLTGLWAETYPGITESLSENHLFEIADHSYSHPSFSGYCYGLPRIAESGKDEELTKSVEALRQATGKTPSLFRFPGGCFSEGDKKRVERFGMKVIGWDIVSGDAFSGDTDGIVRNVISQARDGAIVVAHMNGGPNAPKTYEAFARAIPELRKMGYEFVTVSELLNARSRH